MFYCAVQSFLLIYESFSMFYPFRNYDVDLGLLSSLVEGEGKFGLDLTRQIDIIEWISAQIVYGNVRNVFSQMKATMAVFCFRSTRDRSRPNSFPCKVFALDFKWLIKKKKNSMIFKRDSIHQHEMPENRKDARRHDSQNKLFSKYWIWNVYV